MRLNPRYWPGGVREFVSCWRMLGFRNAAWIFTGWRWFE